VHRSCRSLYEPLADTVLSKLNAPKSCDRTRVRVDGYAELDGLA
jgi:hypothetical protein